MGQTSCSSEIGAKPLISEAEALDSEAKKLDTMRDDPTKKYVGRCQTVSNLERPQTPDMFAAFLQKK